MKYGPALVFLAMTIGCATPYRQRESQHQAITPAVENANWWEWKTVRGVIAPGAQPYKSLVSAGWDFVGYAMEPDWYAGAEKRERIDTVFRRPKLSPK